MTGHILVLLENEPFPHDTRVRQEAAALREAGYAVTVVSPAGFGFDAPEETVEGVRVLRYRAPPGGRGVAGYAREYAVSLVSLHRLARRVARDGPIDVVMVVTAPDLMILLTIGLARRGAGVLVDHHDPSPELFERKFGRRGAMHRVLLRLERIALRRADAVISVNDTCAELARRRTGVPADRVFVVRQGPDPARFRPVDPRPELRRGRRHLVVWMGMLTEPQRVARLLDAAEEIVRRRRIATVAFALVGPGDGVEAVRADVRRRGLADVVTLPGRVDDDLLRAYLATASVCVSVDEHGAMNDLATVTKVLDYMAMERAVVQFPLVEMRRLCGDATAYARNGDVGDLVDTVLGLLDDEDHRRRLGRAARERVLDGLMWPAQVPAYLRAVRLAQDAGRRRLEVRHSPARASNRCSRGRGAR
jgi:glycosyltransferase involved in cell wall biosynthesis